MANVGNLVASLELKAGQFVSEIRRTNQRLGKFESGMKRTAAVGRTAFRSLAGAIAGVGLARLVGESIRASDQIGKFSDRLKISTEALSELQFAGERSGVAFNQLSIGIQRLERRVAEAAVGTGEARGALQELGIDAQKLVRLQLDNQFEIIAEALSRVEEEADRTRLAMKLFDSEGVALVQIMNDGAAGVQRLREEASRLGATLSQEDAVAAAKANDAITNLNTSFQSLTRQLAINVAPALSLLANFLANNLTNATRVAAQSLQEIASAYTQFSANIANAIAGLAGRLASLYEAIGLDSVSKRLNSYAEQVRGTAGALQFYSHLAGAAAEANNQLSISYKNLNKEAGNAQSTLADVATSSNDRPLISEVKIPKIAKRVVPEPKELQGLEFAVANAIEGGAREGAKGLVSAILSEVQRNLVARLAQNIAGAIGGSGGSGGSFASLFGFRTGGSFEVGGTGGPDSKLVGFRATPGERVTVSKPGQQLGGGDQFSFSIDARGADAGVEQRIERGVMRAVAMSRADRIEAQRRARP